MMMPKSSWKNLILLDTLLKNCRRLVLKAAYKVSKEKQKIYWKFRQKARKKIYQRMIHNTDTLTTAEFKDYFISMK